MAKQQGEQNGARPELLAADRNYHRDVAIVAVQPMAKRIFFALWLVLDVVLVGVFVYTILLQLVGGPLLTKRLVARTGSNTAVQHTTSVARAAQALHTTMPSVFALGDGAYDLYAEIENPNGDWYAEFTYSFDTSQGPSKRFQGFVLPNESRPLAAFRQAFSGRPGSVNLTIEDVVWHRVDHTKIGDVSSWLADHEGFVIENAQYGFDVSVGNTSIARSSFTLRNTTPYAYRNPSFFVIISRGSTVVGVNQVTAPGLLAGESRDISATWLSGAPTSGSIAVIPNINYFDETASMPPEGGPAVDIRDRLR